MHFYSQMKRLEIFLPVKRSLITFKYFFSDLS